MKHNTYYSVHTWDNRKLSFGLNLRDDIIKLTTFSDPIRIKNFPGSSWGKAFHITENLIGYYDYQINTLGVVDIYEQTHLWKLKLNRKKTLYIGKWRGEELLAFQWRKEVSILSARSGEIKNSIEVKGEIAGVGESWLLIEGTKKTHLKIGDRLMSFDRRNEFSFAAQFDQYVILIERLGPIRVVDLSQAELIFEKQPEKDSKYKLACISDNEIIFTQHYFERNTETFIHRCKLGYIENDTEYDIVHIPCSGIDYVFLELGLEIAFPNGTVYCTSSGKFLRRF